MNLFTHVREILIDILHDLSTQGILPADTDFSQITVEPPKDFVMGIWPRTLRWFFQSQ